MGSVQDHYAKFLAENYSWMAGGPAEQIAQSRQYFEQAGLAPAEPGLAALDLGCGPGFQAQALAELGYRVVALDSCPLLLQELAERAAGQTVAPLAGDMRDPQSYRHAGPFDLAVCLGDTVIHLESVEEVARLFRDARASLRGGAFALTFRDLTVELTGTDRIQPVRLEDGKLMAVFLEYGPTHVVVHDVLFRRGGDGWHVAKSAYRKLRLLPDRAAEMLAAAGFREVRVRVERGVAHLVAFV